MLFRRKKNPTLTFEVDGDGRIFVIPKWGKKSDLTCFADMVNVINSGKMAELIKNTVEDYGDYKKDYRAKYVAGEIDLKNEDKPLVPPDELTSYMFKEFNDDSAVD